MSQENVELLREAVDAFNRGGIEAALEYLHPDAEWIGPPEWLEERVYEGHDGLRGLASMWTGNFDDYRLDLERVIDTGDRIVALLYQRATIKGSGDQIEQQIGWNWEFRDGKGTRVYVYFSWAEPLAAAGLSE